MSFGRSWRVRHWTSDYDVIVEPRRPLTETERLGTERALSVLLWDYKNNEPDILRELDGIHRALFRSGSLFARPFSESSIERAERQDRVRRDLENAARAGRLALIENVRPIAKVQRVLPGGVVAPGLGPAAEAEPTFFEARFVDEIGEAISGLDVILDADGRAHPLTTDGSGKVRLDGVLASRGSLRVASVKSLRDIVEPRWATLRPGALPFAEPMFKVPLTDDLGSISMESELEHLIVIVPPLGKLFIELYDRLGRVRHANRDYTIDGPMTFSGTTDESGRLVHEGVLPGDYTLTLTLEFFENTKDALSETYEVALVALDAAASEPQQRFVGAVPHVVFARVRGFLFDTNKTFLLPTAIESLEKIRDLYEQNDPSELLIVGHTDTTAEPSINDPLSVARAKSVEAYLKDDVDAWLANYDLSGKQKWGSREDRLMIAAMPDFALRGDDEDLVEWFQRTRDLTVDGIAGPQTRRQLVTEYMAFDGTSLADDTEFHISITTHGAGENHPLAGTGFELDTNAANDQADPHDRRAELFFFDPEFGVRPSPGAADGPEYLEWRKAAAENHDFDVEGIGRKATVVEVHDALFRTNSCVVLPEGETPSSSNHEAITSVGLFATVLRFNEEHAKKKLFIAGHTDTTATIEFNQTLSKERAHCALALLTGDREGFKALADARHTVGDYKQMLSFFTKAFADLAVGDGGFDCAPGSIDDVAATGVPAVRKFQEQYNQNQAAIGATAPPLTVDGDVGPLTWGAMFDVLEFALQRELGEDATAVQALRDELVFVDADRKALGFSEHYPVDQIGRDGVRSQANRRVEVLFFDAGEEPDLVLAESDPDISELYMPGEFEHANVEPMVSALPWKAEWERASEAVNGSEQRLMTLKAPGLPSGMPLTYEISQVLDGEVLPNVATAAGASAAEAGALPFGAWAIDGNARYGGELGETSPFPKVLYRFAVSGGGRRKEPVVDLPYADFVDVVFEHEGSDEKISKAEFMLHTPWGRRRGVTDDEGRARVEELPPGGAHAVLTDGRLVRDPASPESGGDAPPPLPSRRARLRLVDADFQPRAGVPYAIVADNVVLESVTDSDGFIVEDVPTFAARAFVQFDDDEVELVLEDIPPIQSAAGVQRRLNNLGYSTGSTAAAPPEAVEQAALAFRLDHGLGAPAASQEALDDATRNKLVEVHGS